MTRNSCIPRDGLVSSALIFISLLATQAVGCRRAQTDGIPKTTNTSQAAQTTKSAPIEEYKIIDPTKAGFGIALSFRSYTQDSEGKISNAVIARLAFSPDNAFPQAIEGGKKYSIDLVSPKMTDSKLLTKQFGEIRVAELTPYETKVLMTDSQVSKVQEFLKAHETSGAKP